MYLVPAFLPQFYVYDHAVDFVDFDPDTMSVSTPAPVELQHSKQIAVSYAIDDGGEVVQKNYYLQEVDEESSEIVYKQVAEDELHEIFDTETDLPFVPLSDILDFPTSNDPRILLLVLPFAGFGLIRFAESNPESSSFRRITSLFVIFILLGGGVALPGAVSVNYWGSANADVNIPDPLESFQFDTTDTSKLTFEGNAEVLDEDNPSLFLSGDDGYVRVDGSSTNDIKQLTISAWVKPDYSSGSPEFTIVSKEKSFSFVINKLISPAKVVKFSIFDGIKWHTLKSSTVIEEEWTHLTATFGDGSMKIYINGVLDTSLDQVEIDDFEYSEIILPSIDTLSSKADLVVGSYMSYRNGDMKLQNKFSGQIDAVQMYGNMLNPAQVEYLYSENRGSSSSQILKETIENSVNESVETVGEMLSVVNQLPNKFGFTPDGQDQHAQLIHEKFSEGYKVQKPEDSRGPPTSATGTEGTSNGISGIQVFNGVIVVIGSGTTGTATTAMVITTGTTTGTDESSGGYSGIQDFYDGTVVIGSGTTGTTGLTTGTTTYVGTGTTTRTLTSTITSTTTSSTSTTATGTSRTSGKEELLSGGSWYKKMIIVPDGVDQYYASIPEMHLSNGAEVVLICVIDGVKYDVTNAPHFGIEYFDTNGNGIPDQMKWNVPDGVTEFYIESKLTVINVQSFPVVGTQWTIDFTTVGWNQSWGFE